MSSLKVDILKIVVKEYLRKSDWFLNKNIKLLTSLKKFSPLIIIFIYKILKAQLMFAFLFILGSFLKSGPTNGEMDSFLFYCENINFFSFSFCLEMYIFSYLFSTSQNTDLDVNFKL